MWPRALQIAAEDEAGDTFQRRAERGAAAVLLSVSCELKRTPNHRDNAYVALNALAIAAATVIAGTGEVERAWFGGWISQRQSTPTLAGVCNSTRAPPRGGRCSGAPPISGL